MEKITLHRALSELKVLDARITKAIQQAEPVGLYQDGKKVNAVFTKDEFSENAKGKMQSILDLIERKRKIKSLIVKANAYTEVEISGKKMTIAEAINYRSVIDSKKELLQSLKTKRDRAIASMNTTNEQVNQNAIRLAEAALQKDNVKIGDNDAVAITEPYINKNKVEMLDPLGIMKFIDDLENEIQSFESEVDATLSEINAVTFIDL